VGFRPTLHRFATELGLAGWVLNSTTGVVCEVEGAEEACRKFFRRMHEEAPPLSRITSSFMELLPPAGLAGFHIRPSEEEEGEITLISPDTAICADCARELLDPNDRRYRYPFINCTNCGPRYSIIKALPYDRPNTTMREFEMCEECLREYENPEDRRYHAQPNACPVCGPKVWLANRAGKVLAEGDEAVQQTVHLLAQGRIIAVKGLGGFHLACDALNEKAVEELRLRKRRARFKPLAIMAKDFAVLRDLAQLTEKEMALLASPISPIILARKRDDTPYRLSPMVAPRTDLLGVMIPYTPLHVLLFNTQLDEPSAGGTDTLEVLVMTSANLAEEPLVYENGAALDRLAHLADAFLMHNRRIIAPSDDSIVRVMGGEARAIRLGRGYAPYPVALSRDPREPTPEGCVVGWGPDMKATIAMQAGRYAVIGPHLGDQETLAAQAFHRRTYEHFRRVFQQQPDAIVGDLHPGYYSRSLAKQEAEAGGAQFADVQHHHAHLASVALECGVEGQVLALSLDGTGYGSDGAVWGGEILLGDASEFRRVGTLRALALPGGESAIEQTWRLALAILNETDAKLLDEAVKRLKDMPFAPDVPVVAEMVRRNINCVPSTSLGRLFDAFSALMGICLEATYEAQAAIELETAASRVEEADALPMIIKQERGFLVIDWRPAVRAVIHALRQEKMAPLMLPEEYSAQDPSLKLPEVCCRLSRGFVQGLVEAYGETAVRIAVREGVTQVVLSGGCFQNALLFEGLIERLENSGLRVFTHSGVPMNDAGISLGQLAHGLARRA